MTVICHALANSYLQSATASAGAVAELAATRKVAKYSALEDQYVFQPIAFAVESLGPMNCDTVMPASALPILIGEFLACLEMTGKPLFCFNAFLFCYFGLILFSCTTVLSWTTARSISLAILSHFISVF